MKGTFPVKKALTKTELRATQTLAKMLRESGLRYETAVEIVGMRLTYLGKFSIPNLAQVFEVDA